MASKTSAKANLFLSLNLLCYILSTTACGTCNRPSPPSTVTPPSGTPSTPSPTPPSGTPSTPSPTPPSGTPSTPSPTPPSGGGSGNGRCPRDALQLGVCANLLGGLIGVVIGNPPTTPCCTLLAGLADLEAAVCLCTVIRANVLGISLNVPVALSLLLNVCGRNPPTGFTCA